MASPELPIHLVNVIGTYDGLLEGPHAILPATLFGGYFLVRNGDGPFRGMVIDQIGWAYVEGKLYPDCTGFDKLYLNRPETLVRYSFQRDEAVSGQLYTGHYRLYERGTEIRERIAQMRTDLVSTNAERLWPDNFNPLHKALERKRELHLPKRELYLPLFRNS